MLRKHVKIGILPSVLLVLLALAGCAARGENLNTLTADDLFARGTESIENRRFDRAIIYLERFVSQHLGDPRVPEARMLLAEASMIRREYPMAAAHYQRLVTDYPSNPRAREARFGICRAYYLLSPPAPLDQEFTTSALAHCNSVADYYPDTEEGTQARAYVEELREKLARKVFNAGVQYFKLRAYDSARVYFEDVVEIYPDTPVAPEALEQLVETFTRMGYVEDAQAARDRLLRDYPQSPEAQAMQAMQT